jgi:hypothetical protein
MHVHEGGNIYGVKSNFIGIRDRMAAAPRRVETILSPAQTKKLLSAIVNDRLDTFREIVEQNRLRPMDTIDSLTHDRNEHDMPILFMAAGCGNAYGHPSQHYSKHIVEYLVENGADVNAMAKTTAASVYSREFDTQRHRAIISDVYTTVFMNLAINGRVAAMKYFIKHGADVNKETEMDEIDPSTGERMIIAGETAVDLCAYAIERLDNLIPYQPNNKMIFIKDRNNALRGYEFLKGIDVRERVKEPFASTKNYGRANYVFQSAPGVGPLEKKYMLKFLRKPATFKMPRNHELKRINTDLFKGGSTRRRRRTRKN